MLYFIETADGVTVSRESTHAQPGCIHRHDMSSYDHAKDLAARANKTCGETLYLAIDRGEWVYPRYDIIDMPRVGQLVSKAFNGDAYPCGYIASISKSLKVITTTTGLRFYRKRETGSWINDSTWSLVSGHHSLRNPSF